MRIAFTLLVVLGSMTPLHATEPPKPIDIVRTVEAGRQCGQDVHLGKSCSFKIDSLEFTIFGVGEIDTSVGFAHSDMHERYYATSYLGCVGVGTGMAFQQSSAPQQVYVSTKTGNVYLTRKQCQEEK